MASIAIDPSEIRPSAAERPLPEPTIAPPPPASRPGRTKRLLAAAGVGLAVVGVAALAYQSLPSTLPRLAGFASLVDPPKPRRAEIRVGPVPEMPEIRNGVPEIATPKPVRVVTTSPPAPRAAEQARPAVPVLRPAEPMLPPAPAVPAPAEVLASIARPAGPTRDPVATAAVLRSDVAASTPSVRGAAVTPAALTSVAAPVPATLEPAPARSAAVTPLPPPAPARTAALREAPERSAPERQVVERPTPARPVRAAARPAPPAAQPAALPARTVPEPDDDRVEVLGVKIPSVRDVGNAITSLGETVINLPKAF